MKKLLIANRGEVAVRIIRTCKRLKIKTIAIYSEADAGHPHTLAADEAVCVGPAPARESYLNANKIIQVALLHGADAIHPGYGFLSENAEFAKAIEAAGILFIGPTPDTLARLGDKQQARTLAAQLGIPTPPGYNGTKQDLQTLRAEAERIGLPVMLKAVAGGGGRGMRRIESMDGFEHAIESAQREALASFGNNAIFFEKLIYPARHIEVQVLGNGRGSVIHLFERECSLQRRFQKLIEEAPAPFLQKKLRSQILEAAVTLCEAVKLRAAATCEFLVPWSANGEADSFYFLEANPRLQVEHPVTEAITGVDLVELQIKAAKDGKIPKQSAIKQRGHAIEARVYAETPCEDFPPSVGRILSFCDPSQTNSSVRVDHGLNTKVLVGTFYDALLAKVITHEKSREAAITELTEGLQQLHIVGVDTNIPFLQAILQERTLHSSPATTTYLDEQKKILLSKCSADSVLKRASAISILARHLYIARTTEKNPFSLLAYFRPGQGERQQTSLYESSSTISLRNSCLPRPIQMHGSAVLLTQTGTVKTFSIELNGEQTKLKLDEATSSIHVLPQNDGFAFELDGFFFTIEDAAEEQALTKGQSSNETQIITANLPGVISRLLVTDDALVEINDVLATLESMKMEHAIYSPCTGKISEIHVTEGQAIRQGDSIVSVTPLQSKPA